MRGRTHPRLVFVRPRVVKVNDVSIREKPAGSYIDPAPARRCHGLGLNPQEIRWSTKNK